MFGGIFRAKAPCDEQGVVRLDPTTQERMRRIQQWLGVHLSPDEIVELAVWSYYERNKDAISFPSD